MSAAEKFLTALKDVVFLTDRVKSIEKKLDEMATEVVEIDRRLIRIETMVEMAQAGFTRKLPSK